MTTPEVVTTATTRLWLDDEGILHADALASSDESLTSARANVVALARLGNGVRRPLLVDIGKRRSQSRDARNFYAGPEVARIVCAVALLVGNPLSRMLGNVFLGLTKPLVPTRLVEDRETGLVWLRGYLPQGRS
jgi:hypothetical protein